MDKDAEKRVCAKRSVGDSIGSLDRLSDLPDCLLHQVLMNLPTKDVVKSSVLSSRWSNLWKSVPGLDLEYGDFPAHNAFVSFGDRFLGFNSESCIQNFKLKFDYNDDDEPDIAHYTRWINAVVERKVQHLHVLERTFVDDVVEIPPTVYTCDSLVSLKLCSVILANPTFVSLPCVKVIHLDTVEFANDLAFEMLISGCPVLESLTLWRPVSDNVKVLRVRSQSLVRFTLMGHFDDDIDQVVIIDAPMLKYLKLDDHETSFIINNPISLVKVAIDIMFNLSNKRLEPNDLPKRKMIRNFLVGISNVKVMKISSHTLEVIYDYSRCEQLPLFRNLSFLHADFFDYRWEMLPVFLESCPNLKSLSLGFSEISGKEGISILPGSHGLLPSLEFVKIVKPMVEEAKEMKLVSYFLEKSTILKEFTFFLGDFRKSEESVILRKLLAIPRLSSSCQVLVV